MSIFKQSSRSTLRSALGSPATPQGVINTKAHIDRVLVRQCMINSGDHILQSQSYSGGGLRDNHTIQKHDVTLGLRSQNVVQKLLNHPNLKVIAAFNGFNYRNYPTDNHIARAFFFTGVALDIETYDANRKDSGLALQYGGVYTILNTGSYTLKPGMLVRWRPPPTGRGIPGGVPMSQLPMDSWNPGDPRGKLFPIIEPYNPRDFNDSLTGMFATVFRSASYAQDESPGIKGAPFSQLYDTAAVGPNKDMARNTSHQDEAMGIKYGLVGCVLQGVFALYQMGMINFNPGGAARADAAGAGRGVRDIAERLGLFSTDEDPTAEQELRTLLAYVFWKHVPSTVVQQSVDQQYRAAFSDGFSRGLRPVDNYMNTDANMARMFTDSLSNLFGCVNGAAQEERSSIIGKQLNEAQPGEGATVCFGMRNQ
jgi:hypothetical protein